LLGLASVAILLPSASRQDARVAHHQRFTVRVLLEAAAIFGICIYGGYFGAAAGVMALALMLVATGDTLARSNALKNVVLGMANAVAAVGFALFGSVEWAAVVPLAVGLLAGGRLGPVVVRHSNAQVLRVVIGLAGLALAIKLGADAYG
jgi:uncharacterized membrane protein YfcA